MYLFIFIDCKYSQILFKLKYIKWQPNFLSLMKRIWQILCGVPRPAFGPARRSGQATRWGVILATGWAGPVKKGWFFQWPGPAKRKMSLTAEFGYKKRKINNLMPVSLVWQNKVSKSTDKSLIKNFFSRQ